MSVKAKFKVQRIERSAWGGGQEVQTIVLQPVYGNGDQEHENTKFYAATPSGEIRLGTVNPEAARQFDLNKEYYVEFTSADQPVASPAAGLGNHPVSIPLEVAFPQTAD